MVGKYKNSEMVAYDLRPVMKSHPQYAAMIRALTLMANPRFVLGFASMAYRQRVMKEEGEVDLVQDFFAFEGETPEQKDGRDANDYKNELLAGMTWNLQVCDDELIRLIWALKPAYYYVYNRAGKAAIKILKPNKKGLLPGLPALDIEKLLEAKQKLETLLLDTYGEKALFKPLKAGPAEPRVRVYVQTGGLLALVTLTDKESRRKELMVDDVAFEEFVRKIPNTCESFNVKKSYGSRDARLCDPE